MVDNLDGKRFREKTFEEYNRALGHLRDARVLVLLAILTIAVGTLIAWSATLFAKPPAGTLAIVRAGSTVYCGPVAQGTSNGPLVLNQTPIPTPVDDFTTVETCPGAASSGSLLWLKTNKTALEGAGVTTAVIALATLGYVLWSFKRTQLWIWVLAVTGLVLSVVTVLYSLSDNQPFAQIQWCAIVATVAVGVGWLTQVLISRVVRAL